MLPKPLIDTSPVQMLALVCVFEAYLVLKVARLCAEYCWCHVAGRKIADCSCPYHMRQSPSVPSAAELRPALSGVAA
jgi:hypothetical protein